MSTETMPKQVLELADQVGSFIEYWGFKKIHGRIWTLVFLAEEPVDANYLIRHLDVSKALVSMSLKDLMHYRVVLECPKEKATIHYKPNLKITSVILDVLLNREAKMLLNIRTQSELLSRTDPDSLCAFANQDRVKALNNMVKTADDMLKVFLALKGSQFKPFKECLTLENKV